MGFDRDEITIGTSKYKNVIVFLLRTIVAIVIIGLAYTFLFENAQSIWSSGVPSMFVWFDVRHVVMGLLVGIMFWDVLPPVRLNARNTALLIIIALLAIYSVVHVAVVSIISSLFYAYSTPYMIILGTSSIFVKVVGMFQIILGIYLFAICKYYVALLLNQKRDDKVDTSDEILTSAEELSKESTLTESTEFAEAENSTVDSEPPNESENQQEVTLSFAGKYKKGILFTLRTIIALALLCVTYVIIATYFENAWMMVDNTAYVWAGLQNAAIGLFAGIIMWEVINLPKAKLKNTALLLILIWLATYLLTYYWFGSFLFETFGEESVIFKVLQPSITLAKMMGFFQLIFGFYLVAFIKYCFGLSQNKAEPVTEQEIEEAIAAEEAAGEIDIEEAVGITETIEAAEGIEVTEVAEAVEENVEPKTLT